MADAPPEEGGEGGTAVFFKRRVARGNLRKREADDDGEGVGGGGGGEEGPSVVRPAPKARREGALGGSTAAREADAKPAFAYEADRQRQAAGDGGATASLETETPFDRDARAAREAVLAQASRLGADGREVDDGLYHGASAYIDYRKGFRREHTAGAEKAGGNHGPLRAPTNVRFTFIMDYKPDICKDYKETGYCGYGDSCKFMHDRGDYKAGWQLDREWDEKEKTRKAREAAAVAGMLAEVEGGEAPKEEEAEDDLPFACFICRRAWADARDPVVTRCKHYFCEQCALQHNAKNKTCATCMVRCTFHGAMKRGLRANAAARAATHQRRVQHGARDNAAAEGLQGRHRGRARCCSPRGARCGAEGRAGARRRSRLAARIDAAYCERATRDEHAKRVRSSPMRSLHSTRVSLQPVRPARCDAASPRRLPGRCSPACARRGARLRLAAASEWQTATDAASGKPYFWNTRTNETAWELPADAAPQPEAAAEAAPAGATLSFEELEALLCATQPVYLSKVVEPHRDAAFSDAFTDFLTAKIAASADKADKERLEKLRARLANPLIRQPPPFV
jgi:RING finger protein 113A